MAGLWFEKYKPVLAMVGLQIIFGSTSVTVKASLNQGISPMVFVTYRQSIAALVLIPTTLLTRRRRTSRVALGLKGFCLVFLAALLGASLSQVLYYHGMQMSSTSTAGAINNTIPAITFLIAASLGIEKVHLKNLRNMAKVLGTIICVGGAISMALFKGQKLLNLELRPLASALHTVTKEWLIGCMFLLASSVCWSFWYILQVPIFSKYLDPLSFSTWICSLAFFQSAALTFFLEPELSVWKVNSSFVIICLVYVAIVGSGVTYFIQSWCISKRGPLFAAMFSPLATVVVIIMAFFFLGESLYIGSLVGAIAVVGGLYIVLWGKANDFPTKIEQCEEEDCTQVSIIVDEPTKTSDDDLKEPFLN